MMLPRQSVPMEISLPDGVVSPLWQARQRSGVWKGGWVSAACLASFLSSARAEQKKKVRTANAENAAKESPRASFLLKKKVLRENNCLREINFLREIKLCGRIYQPSFRRPSCQSQRM